jgi:hypothetical protein
MARFPCMLVALVLFSSPSLFAAPVPAPSASISIPTEVIKARQAELDDCREYLRKSEEIRALAGDILTLAFDPKKGFGNEESVPGNEYGGVTLRRSRDPVVALAIRDASARLVERRIENAAKDYIFSRRYDISGVLRWEKLSVTVESGSLDVRWLDLDPKTGVHGSIFARLLLDGRPVELLVVPGRDGSWRRAAMRRFSPSGEYQSSTVLVLDAGGRIERLLEEGPGMQGGYALLGMRPAPFPPLTLEYVVSDWWQGAGFFVSWAYPSGRYEVADLLIEDRLDCRWTFDEKGRVAKYIQYVPGSRTGYLAFDIVDDRAVGTPQPAEPYFYPRPLPAVEPLLPRLVFLDSDAAGVDVLLDGKRMGTAPCVVALEGGKRLVLALSGRGYLAAAIAVPKRAFAVVGRASLGAYDVAQRRLTIASAPTAGADLSINGKPMGKTPCVVTFEGRLKLDIAVSKNGCKLERQIAETASGESRLDLDFDAESRTLDVRSSPPGAGVVVNGKRLGETPLRTEAYGSPLRIVVGKAGRVAYHQEASLAPGESISIDATLPFDWKGYRARVKAGVEAKREKFKTIGIMVGGTYASLKEPALADVAASAAGISLDVYRYPRSAGFLWSFGMDAQFGTGGMAGTSYNEFLASARIGAAAWIGAFLSPYARIGGGLGFRMTNVDYEQEILSLASVTVAGGARIALKRNSFLWGEYELMPRGGGPNEWNARVKAGLCWGIGPADSR